jgi:outer membrane receptor for ferrienterochelin and colicins
MKIALALGVLVIAVSARADDTADEAEFRFQRATEFYAKGKYEEALAEFFASNRLARNRNVIFDIARCYEHLDRFNEAYRYYNDLLAEQLPATERTSIREALGRLRPHVALVRVESDPPGAEIYAERKDLGSRGNTPKTLALPPGRVMLILELPGHHPAKKAVNIVKGVETSVQMTLSLITGTIEIEGTHGAIVRLDKADSPPVCTIPCKTQVLPGKHTVQVSLTGYTSSQTDADVPADGVVRMRAELPVPPPPKGSIVITANRTGALVRLDGREAGFTPTVVEATQGEHSIEVLYEDYETWTTSVTVKADSQTFVNATLQFAQPQVVAASKVAMRAEDAPASVTVITSDELRAMGYMTLAQALSGVRGFYTTYDHVYDYVGVRGFSPPGDYSSRELVLVDGHPIMDWWSGQNYVGYDFNVDLSLVDRIEVVRGPGSALYGTSAFFAVINVVTRGAALGAHAEGLLGAGSDTSGWGRAVASYQTDKLGILLSGAVMGSGGDSPVVYDNARTLVFNQDGWTAAHADGRVTYGPFTLFGQYQSRFKDIPMPPDVPGGTQIQAGPPVYHDERDFLELRFDQDIGPSFNVVARAYADVSRWFGVFPNDPPQAFLYESGGATWVGGEARVIVGPILATKLTLGVEAQDQQIFERSNQGSETVQPLDTHVEQVYSIYALAEWHPLPGLRFTPGVRADYYGQSFGWTVNPRIGLVFHPYEGGVTKLIAGSAFRAPTVYDRFYTDVYSTQPTQIAGGPGLKPEQVETVEIEHTHQVTGALSAVVDVYGSRITDLIELAPNIVCPNMMATCSQYQNDSGAVRQLGAEVELRWRPERYILASVAYSFAYVREIPSGSSFLTSPGERVPNSPEHLAVGKLMVPLATTAVMAGLQLNFASSRLASSSDRVDTGSELDIAATLSGELPRYHLRYSLTAGDALSAGSTVSEVVFLPGGNELNRDLIPQPGPFFRAQIAAAF